MKRVFILLLLLNSPVLFAQETSRFIDVNGTSEILAQADYISFVVNIRNTAETLDESRQNNINASNELVTIINEFQISKEDWELSPIKFGREYSYIKEVRKQTGYFSQVSVSIKLRKLNDYYPFINELSKNKLYEIARSDYGVSDFLKYHKEATIKAVKAAKEKAEYIAESMGVKTGKILEIKELNMYESYPNPFNTVTNLGKSSEDISGKISISRSVNMKIELID